MEKRLKKYLAFIADITEYYENKLLNKSCEEVAADGKIGGQKYPSLEFVMEDLLKQIEFFQHERLVHLIVTVVFAILTVISVYAAIAINFRPLLVVPILFIVLLIPYIRHYFVLENGVQKLYGFYDRLMYIRR